MQNAGMLPLVDFDCLPVSGFGDVLPKYFLLRKNYKVLETALKSVDCKGLVSIDYPGFNMKLVALAKKLNKPVLYVAPPQIWAWKSHRAKLFANNDGISLATFFDFEVESYRQANCNVKKMIHPFAELALRKNRESSLLSVSCHDKVLLLPGSRKSQAIRNIPVFITALEKASQELCWQDKEIVLLAARESLVPVFEKVLTKLDFATKLNVTILVSPTSAESRMEIFRSAIVAISSPGTATLELALSDCSTVVCTKPDALTMALAKRSVKTNFFALPNIILKKEIFPEFISRNFNSTSVAAVVHSIKKMTKENPLFSKDLLQNLRSDYNSEKLMSEFLAKLI